MKINYEETGRKIRELRKTQGFTIQELCQKLDYAEERSVQLLQTGKGLTQIKTLYYLSAIFNAPVSEILKLNDEEFEPKLSPKEQQNVLE